MLLTYQLPLCDARRFLPDAQARLVGPDWPAPTPGVEFVRSFGPVERRRRGGHEEFHDETAYADARGAVRFGLLDAYLAAAARVLQRDEHGGFSHAAVQEVVSAYEAVANPDELAILSERLEQVRRQIRGTVERYTRRPAGASSTVPPATAESGDTIRVVVSYSHADGAYVIETHYADPGTRKQLYLDILRELRAIGAQIRAGRP